MNQNTSSLKSPVFRWQTLKPSYLWFTMNKWTLIFVFSLSAECYDFLHALIALSLMEPNWLNITNVHKIITLMQKKSHQISINYGQFWCFSKSCQKYIIFMIVPFIEQKIPEFSDLSKWDKRISSQISYPDIQLLIVSCSPILPEPWTNILVIVLKRISRQDMRQFRSIGVIVSHKSASIRHTCFIPRVCFVFTFLC